jgi:beta-glucosidase
LLSGGASALIVTGPVETPNRAISSVAFDRAAQEDSRRFIWADQTSSSVMISNNSPLDISREANGELSLEIDLKMDSVPNGPIVVSQYCGAGCKGSVDITAFATANQGKGWTQLSIPLSCFVKRGADMTKITTPFELSASGRMDVSISRVALGSSNVGKLACPG